MASRDQPDVDSIVQAEIDDAVSFLDLDIAPDRTRATEYYRGKPFGDEQDGQSKVVSTDVRDTVLAIMPSLLRVFFGSENVVEYVPRRPDAVEGAEQATEYVRYIISEDNPGYLTIQNTFKDALISKTGVIKAGWETRIREVKTENYTGQSDATLAMFEQEAANEQQYTKTVTVKKSQPDPAFSAGPMQPPGAQPVQGPVEVPQIHDFTVRCVEDCSRLRIYSIPPEEFLISRRATCVEDADFVGHRSLQTVSDLMEMGFTEEELGNAGTDSELDTNLERLARDPASIQNFGTSENPAMRRIMYVEGYIKLDMDGDGIAELRRVQCIGDQHKVLRNDPAEEKPFATFCPDPEPHVFFGSSIADKTMDIQRIKSQMWRGILNSLAQSINPRTGVVEGQVNMADVLNNENGGIIRMRAPGMVQPYAVPFVGQQALPLLQMIDDVRESRTGITRASQGLDADAMQSTTKAAVMATVTAAQQQLEMIARNFAETGMKDLFKLILRIICRHQDKPRIIRLRKKFVPMAPKSWDATMDVSVNVGLGAGTNDEKISILQAVAAKQELILTTLGPSNPIVSPAQYAHTLRKAIELAGFKDSSLFFSEVPANWQPPAQGAPAPSPQEKAAALLADAQREEIQSSIQKKGAELELKQREMMLTDSRARYQIESTERTAMAEIAAKYAVDTTKAQNAIDLQNQQIQSDERQAMLAAHTQTVNAPQPTEGPTQ